MRAGSSVKDSGHGGRVNGVLETTRGLGNHGDPMLKAVVLAEPHTLSITIDSQSEFLILASNGLWEVLSEQEVVSLVKQLMPCQVFPQQPLQSDDSMRDLYGVAGLNLAPSVGTFEQDKLEKSMETNDQNRTDSNFVPIEDKSGNRDERTEKLENCDRISKPKSASGVKDSEMDHNAPSQQMVRSAPPFIDDSVTEDDLRNRSSKTQPSPGQDSIRDQNEDNSSDQTEFESMISALMENDDGNEADVETLTELHTIYAQSRLLEVEQGEQTEHEMYRNLAQQMSERLIQSALLAGSRDNITAMIILLPGCKF